MLNRKGAVLMLALAVVSGGLTMMFQPINRTIAWENESVVITTGTVEYIGIEGGFFGIVADNGNHYDPTNLVSWYKVDGLRVFFGAIIRHDVVGFHMWGEYIDVVWMMII